MTQSIQTYRDLEVWQRAIVLTEMIYERSRVFPREEIYGLTSQIRRAAVSIPSNIAEGHRRASIKEYCHHLTIARGSLAEVETQLLVSERLGYLTAEALHPLWEQAQTTGRLLNGLIRALSH